MPCAIAYDLVLEDHILARQRIKRSQKAFSRELAEMVRYAVDLRSLTQGRGSFTTEFSHYEEVPAPMAEAVIAAAREQAS